MASTPFAQNADINKKDRFGNSVLLWAAQNGHEPAVRLLLARVDIDTSLRNDDGEDCLDSARSKEIKQLIAAHRSTKEKQRLINIGLGFASKQLPLLLLVNIYEQTADFDHLSMYQCWEILKLLKKQ